ncbi:MAG: hypothetical protein ACYCQJ_15915 [Nitrososphaerales archaeon]
MGLILSEMDFVPFVPDANAEAKARDVRRQLEKIVAQNRQKDWDAEHTNTDPNYQALVRDVRAKGDMMQGGRILGRLRGGMYGDFTSLYPCPKLMLADHLSEIGWLDLSKKAYRGDYDF